MILLALFALYAVALSVALGRLGLRRHRDTPVPAKGVPRTRLLIIGATGGTGRQVVAQALERGLTVTVLVRNPLKLRVQHPQLSVVRGDVLDYESVDAAVRGQDAVVCVLGHKTYFRPTRILSEGTRHILRAMEANHVSRLVCQTSLGIGDSAGRMGLYYTFVVIPLILPFYFWDKTRQERLIAASQVEWVIVRPGLLTNGEGRGAHRDGPGVGSFLTTVRISRSDVAEFLLDQIDGSSYVGAAPGVCW
jgi:uncharacterized protein YbjT (DUF2867 family)